MGGDVGEAGRAVELLLTGKMEMQLGLWETLGDLQGPVEALYLRLDRPQVINYYL